MKMKAPIIYKV